MQRSTVKVSYARNRRGTSWRAHGVYLSREGAQREGERGLGFDAAREDIDVAAMLRAWQSASDERLWKFVVSPERATHLDLREHTRDLAGHMERDLGSHLEWVGVDHYDTDNPHVHLLVRGRDLDGRSLRIPRDYIVSGVRQRSQELATQRLGLRSDREILAARSHAAERMQVTEIDRMLLHRADDRGIVSYRGPVPRPGPRRERYTHELRRLQFLEIAGLAEKTGTRTWRLAPGMEATLRQAQLIGDIVKSRARHRPHLSDPRMPLVITDLKIDSRVTGRLVGVGRLDELQERGYYLLEGTDGRLHYVPLPSTIWRHARRQVRIGDLITVAKCVHREQGQDTVRTNVRIVADAPVIVGLTYRGELQGYARGADKQRYAIMDTGYDEAMAFPARDADISVGREMRASSHRAEDRRQIIWQLVDEERERQRQRDRGRER